MRFMPIVLLVAILLNFGCVLVFRLKLDRKTRAEFSSLSETLQKQVSDFSSAALASIDAYFVSNSVSRASSSPVDDTVSEIDITFHKEIGDWDYDYFLTDGKPLARVGVFYFRLGDAFPRGGRITDIFPDCVVVNDRFLFRNRLFFSRSNSSSSAIDKPLSFADKSEFEYKPNKELATRVGTMDNLRK